jgi:hypothetical protein
MTTIPLIPSASLIRPLRYHYGVPFITSAALAVMTTAWLQTNGGMWGWAVMVLISTAFALFCGGRFRTFFAAIAVTPPFFFAIGWLLRLHSAVPVYFPLRSVCREAAKSFFWFTAAVIFEIGLGISLGYTRERLLADYNLARVDSRASARCSCFSLPCWEQSSVAWTAIPRKLYLRLTARGLSSTVEP